MPRGLKIESSSRSRVRLAADFLQDGAEHEIARIAVAIFRSGRELQRLIAEGRDHLVQRASRAHACHEVRRFGEIRDARGVHQQVPDGDLAPGRGAGLQVVAHRIRDRERPALLLLQHQGGREGLGDRRDGKAGCRRVGNARFLVGESVALHEQGLAVTSQQHRAAESSGVGERLQIFIGFRGDVCGRRAGRGDAACGDEYSFLDHDFNSLEKREFLTSV